MLRKGIKSDANALARIHLSELHYGFLPSLGEDFLRLLYLNLLQSNNTYIWVDYSGGTIRGFIVGSKNFKNVFNKIIMKNFLFFLKTCLVQILKDPIIIKNILEMLLYAKKEERGLPRAELIVIAVSQKFHRNGIGRRLVNALEKDFVKYGIKKYKLTMYAINSSAELFYKKQGFIKVKEFFLNGNKNFLFVKKNL